MPDWYFSLPGPFILVAVSIVIYWALWGRYLLRGRDFSLLYRPLGFVPIPMAVFPVLAFGFAALWGGSWWIGGAVAALAIGHLANSWHVFRAIEAGAQS